MFPLQCRGQRMHFAQTKNSGHYVPTTTPKGSARTLLGPIILLHRRLVHTFSFHTGPSSSKSKSQQAYLLGYTLARQRNYTIFKMGQCPMSGIEHYCKVNTQCKCKWVFVYQQKNPNFVFITFGIDTSWRLTYWKTLKQISTSQSQSWEKIGISN